MDGFGGGSVPDFPGLDPVFVRRILSNPDIKPLFHFEAASLTQPDGYFCCFGGELRWFKAGEPFIAHPPDQQVP